MQVRMLHLRGLPEVLIFLTTLLIVSPAFAQTPISDADGDGIEDTADPTPYFTSVPDLEFEGFVTTVGLNYEYTGDNQTVVKDQREIEFTSELNNDVTRTERDTDTSKLVRSLDVSVNPSNLASSVAKLNASDESTTSSERVFTETQKKRLFEKTNKFVESVDTTKANFTAKAGIITGYLRFRNRTQKYISVKSALVTFRFIDRQGRVGEVMPQQTIADIEVPPFNSKNPYFFYPVTNETISTARILSILRRNLLPSLNIDDITLQDGDNMSMPFLLLSQLEALTAPITIVGPGARTIKFYVSPEIAASGSIFDVLQKLPIEAIVEKGSISSILGVSSTGLLKKPPDIKKSDLLVGRWIVARETSESDDGDNLFKIGQRYTVAFITNQDVLRASPDVFELDINAEPGQGKASPVCVQADQSTGLLTTTEGMPFELRPGTVVRLRISSTLRVDKVTEVIPKRDYPSAPSEPGPQPWTQWKQYWQFLDRFVRVTESRIDFDDKPVLSSNLGDYGVLVSFGEPMAPLEDIVARSGRVTDEASTGAVFAEFRISARDLTKSAGPLCIQPQERVTEKKEIGRSWYFDFPKGTATTPGFAKEMQAITKLLDTWKDVLPRQPRELKSRHQIRLHAEIERPIVLTE